MRSASVSQALRSLSPAHREVLNETYFCSRSVNEAARVLGMPVETVKCRVYDALHALRVQIDRIEQATAAPAAAHAGQGYAGQGHAGHGHAPYGHAAARCGQRVNTGPAAPEWR